MSAPIQAGDLAEVIDGLQGKDSPNLGLIVKVLVRVGAEPLTVQMQDGRPCLWMRVPTDVYDYQAHRFYWVGTGQECPFPSAYVGTVQLDGYVWHLFHG